MKIITDSTADLTLDMYRKYDIGVVPLTIHLGEKSWRDLYDIEPGTFYAILKKTKVFPTTSQPSPQDFIDAYEPFVKKGEPVLSIHISAKLSGTYQAAFLARNHFPDARIEVIDSLQASLGLGIIILLCEEKARLGASFEEVVQFAREVTGKVETYFTVDSLDYLQRGGRIGKAQALLGTLMKIKPLLKLVGGEIQPLEKIRTSEKLLGRLVELVEKEVRAGARLRLSAAQAGNAELMTSLLDRLIKIPGVSLLYRCDLGGVIASHTGPGALSISFVKE